MCVYEVRSPPSLKLDRVDKIERCVEDGRADVEVSEHPCFTAVEKSLDDMVEEGRPRGDLMNVLNLMFAADRLSLSSGPFHRSEQDVMSGGALHC